MENSINKQFKMNQGAHAENNTETSFRNPEKVAQAGGMPMMGDPINYGSPLPDKGHGTKPSKDDGHTHTSEEVYQMAMNKVQKQLKNNKDKEQSGRAGDFSIGPIKGNLNRYGEGG
tara:strand:- start:26 stop:373 length:348 start_codon:yes stop_codon:yes gene_type:complete